MAALALVGLGLRTGSTLLPGGDVVAAPPISTAPSEVRLPSSTMPWPPTTSPNTAAPSPTATAAIEKPVEGPPTQEDEEPVNVPATGPGTYTGAKVAVDSTSSAGTLRRFDVRVEKGLDINPDQAATLIAEVLGDKRSWRGSGRWRFELVESGQSADLHAYIVTPGTTDRLCAPLLTRGEVSCQNGNRVVLNAKRWVHGAESYGDDVTNYRRYLINHEFGHALGHQHVGCPGRGQPAPVMMQQTKGLGVCSKNPWPSVSGD